MAVVAWVPDADPFPFVPSARGADHRRRAPKTRPAVTAPEPGNHDAARAQGRRALTPGNLAEDFAIGGTGAEGLGAGLVAAWREALGPDEGEAGWLLAAQAAYALVVKLVAARVLEALRPGPEVPAFDMLAVASDDALRRFLAALEDGRPMRAAGLDDVIVADGPGWCAAAERWTPGLARAARAAIAHVATYDAGALLRPSADPCDLFRPLYERLIPASARHDLGEYYTPRWLAQAVLADLPAPPGWRGLDPCCGSGAFVVELVAEALAETRGRPAAERLRDVLGRVAGLDLNPLAVLTARVNYLLAVAPLLAEAGPAAGPIAIPVHRADATAAPAPAEAAAAWGAFERVAGNPPWVEWKDLPAGYREAVGDRCRARGLFSDDGYVGGTDLNVCALIAHVALERWVAPGGHLGFLMPHQLLQVRSCQGLRRWRLPDGSPVALVGLADWTALRPFEAACRPVTYLVRRGQAGPEAVPMAVWRARPGAPSRAHADAWRDVAPTLRRHDEAARPVDADGGPYLVDEAAALPELLALLGESAYRGRRATETSPHGVYWVRPAPGAVPVDGLLAVAHGINPRARDGVAPGHARLEPDRLFPLLRGADVAPFAAAPGDALVILPHDASTGAKALPPERMPPATLAYLEGFRALLERRSSYKEYRAGEPFYGLWRVGPYTFAPWKVVWPELGELRAAVVGTAPTPWGEPKLVVPEGKLNLVACADPGEAHYLCALLNAPAIRRAYARMSSQIGRPSRLPFAIAPHDPTRWTHRALAAASRAAHAGVLGGDRRDAMLGWLARRARRAIGGSGLRDLNLVREPDLHPPAR